MNPTVAPTNIVTPSPELPALLRGDLAHVRQGVERWDRARVVSWLATIVAGSALFGAAMGWWRDPLQAGYAAVKFPLIILLTTLGNALINAMLAPLLGVNISLRQSLLAVLMSFAIASAILGAFAPLMAFLVWNTPPLDSAEATATGTYRFVQLAFVAVIAFAGVAANLRLRQLLDQLGGSAAAARRVLFAWLAVNLLLGSQLTWIFRPFIGIPGRPVEFLRQDAFSGNFYETVLIAIRKLLSME
ncbi:MAG: hypothetical protein FJ386_10420 [Verrucomicrobia bacterium]|nr:hypothetical protein [Verrucomicrobiota bacterium]